MKAGLTVYMLKTRMDGIKARRPIKMRRFPGQPPGNSVNRSERAPGPRLLSTTVDKAVDIRPAARFGRG